MIKVSATDGLKHYTDDGLTASCGLYIEYGHWLRHHDQTDVDCKFCRAAIEGERVAAEAPEITMQTIVGEAIKRAEQLFNDGDLDKDMTEQHEFYRWIGTFVISANRYKCEVMTK